MDDAVQIKRAAGCLADLLASTLMPDGNWSNARAPYAWEFNALCWLHQMQDKRGPINGWTAMLLSEGYPAAKAGEDCGKFWKPGDAPRWEDE